ncbi:hypothetical protein LDL36_19675 [Komagataeibacter sp. FNDCR1]|nr:hypothetical protein [Komagataeibacter sp. FNDCR1]
MPGLGLFWETPDELVLAALGSTVLAGLLSCAYRHVERGMNSVQHVSFSGFHILGMILWLTIACFGASWLSRKRASFNVPRLYCDRASWGMPLFCLVKIYVFLQSSQTETSQSLNCCRHMMTKRTERQPAFHVESWRGSFRQAHITHALVLQLQFPLFANCSCHPYFPEGSNFRLSTARKTAIFSFFWSGK